MIWTSSLDPYHQCLKIIFRRNPPGKWKRGTSRHFWNEKIKKDIEHRNLEEYHALNRAAYQSEIKVSEELSPTYIRLYVPGIRNMSRES